MLCKAEGQPGRVLLGNGTGQAGNQSHRDPVFSAFAACRDMRVQTSHEFLLLLAEESRPILP